MTFDEWWVTSAGEDAKRVGAEARDVARWAWEESREEMEKAQIAGKLSGDIVYQIGALLSVKGAQWSGCPVGEILAAAHERIPAWRDAAGAVTALAELLGLEPPLPSPDEIVAVAVDGLLLLREAYEADQAEDLDRLRVAFAKAGRLLGKMKLPPPEGGE